MKLQTFALATLLALPVASQADAGAVELSAKVKVDDAPIQAFGYVLQPGQLRTLDLPFGALRIELAARNPGGTAAPAHVRLLLTAAGSGVYRVLHEADLSDPSPAGRDFAYLVCGQRATFISPAPAQWPDCTD